MNFGNILLLFEITVVVILRVILPLTIGMGVDIRARIQMNVKMSVFTVSENKVLNNQVGMQPNHDENHR